MLIEVGVGPGRRGGSSLLNAMRVSPKMSNCVTADLSGIDRVVRGADCSEKTDGSISAFEGGVPLRGQVDGQRLEEFRYSR